jgi:energy-converting hydrogenase Eha subunit A
MLNTIVITLAFLAVAVRAATPLVAWSSDASILGAQPALRIGQSVSTRDLLGDVAVRCAESGAVVVVFVADRISYEDMILFMPSLKA